MGEGQEPRAQGISEADPHNFILALLVNTCVTLNKRLNFPKSQLLCLQSGVSKFVVQISGETSHQGAYNMLGP